MTLPVVFTANGPSGYNLTNSLRFRSSASAYLNRTFASAGNQKTWTWSAWVKRGSLSTGTSQNLFGVIDLSVTNRQNYLTFQTDNTLAFYNYTTSGYNYQLITTQVFRDPSAWYHIVCVSDTTQATSSNRLKMYVNGTQITAFGTASYPSQNFDGWISGNTGSSVELGIGRVVPYNTSEYFDGYLAEVNFIDGQALTPSSFGETSATTGVWIPKKYTGTYGTNGFYLPFTDNSALTTSSNVGLGKDFSGNSNYFATNNISITAGSTYDSMTDVPTLTSATAANYATLNPLNTGGGTYSNGNLQWVSPATDLKSAQSTIALNTASTGKWYWEVTCVSKTGTNYQVMLTSSSTSYNTNPWLQYRSSDGVVTINGSSVGTFSTFTTGDVIGVTFDASNSQVALYKNNTLVTTQTISNTSNTYIYAALGSDSSGGTMTYAINFGQRPFAYTPPTGFNRLNTFNLTTPTIGATASTQANKYFDATLYTGNNSTNNIVNSGSMQPDMVWLKGRSQSSNHIVQDSVRGANRYLLPNLTGSEGTDGSLTSFNSNGFSLTTDAGVSFNANGTTYVGWQWKAGGTGVTNTAGSITSTVSANTSAGFSIVTYTGNGTGGATVGHGLGVAPSMIIIKVRNATARWVFYQKDVTTANNQFLELNSTTGVDTSGTNFWTISSINSTTFGLGTNADTNGSTLTFVAYCFAPIAGYSAFGSYTGNGSSDGTFVYTGFRPAFLMIKRTNAAVNWYMFDNKRNTYNAVNLQLSPNLSNAEASDFALDFLSNGFKFRIADSYVNGSGDPYIYMAFAESPFRYANAR